MSTLQPLQWEVEQQGKITLRLRGELSRSTLLPLYQAIQHHQLFPAEHSSQSILLDLSDISRIDSAGFALLCELIHQGKQTQVHQIQLLNPPVQITTLADLFGLSDWIASLSC